jgi:DNA-binding response OmpR family regulator
LVTGRKGENQRGAALMCEAKKTLVLVADDEPSTRALVANHMQSRGFEVIEAADGDEAWTLAHTHLPDLVILDVMMPGMSGWEVCRRIRDAVSLAHTGVVMLTGIGENLNEMTSPLYGADAYIDKPFEFSQLDAYVQATLERRREGAVGRPDGANLEELCEGPESAPPVSEELATGPAQRRRARSARQAAKPAKQQRVEKQAASERSRATHKRPQTKSAEPVRKQAPARATKKAKPTRQAPKRAGKQAAKKAVKKLVKKPAPRPAKKAAKKLVKKLVRRPAKKAARRLVRRPAKKVAKKLATRPARKAAKKLVRRPAKKAVRRPAKKVAKKLATRPAKKAAKSKLAKRTAKRPAQRGRGPQPKLATRRPS